MPSQLITTSQTWSWPPGVTEAVVECIGGGGAGGGATGNPAAGAGGRGGHYARATVTKGVESGLVCTVGAGGIGGASNGGSGGETSVSQNGTVVVSAKGGGGGSGASTNNTNGVGASSDVGTNTGSVVRFGGQSEQGNFTSGVPGGSGGGAGGPDQFGGIGSGSTGGSGGGGDAGNGAGGVGNSTAGAAGSNYGGGGSGGKANNNTDRNGGNGAPGVVRITWADLTQATTRFYNDDGSDTTATARSAQDADLTETNSSDLNLHFRTRIQNNTATSGASRDFFGLQVRKNNGTWTRIGKRWADQFSNMNGGVTSIYSGASISAAGNSFQAATSGTLDSATFTLSRNGTSPTGNLVAKLYAHSGTFGTSSTRGTLLATSDNVTLSTLSNKGSDAKIITFTFSGANRVSLTEGTYYVIQVDAASAGDVNNQTIVYLNNATGSGHPGNTVFNNSAESSMDVPFSVTIVDSPWVVGRDSSNLTNGATIATGNFRLGTGSGAAVAGLVSEVGTAENLNVTASNYTELLYAATVKLTALAPSDVVEFRVGYNGMALKTHTVTPRITVTSAGGTTYTQSIGGSIGPTGTVTKSVTVRKTGSTSPTGVIKRDASAFRSGAITPAGAIARFVARALAGQISPASVITASRLFLQSVAGQISPSAIIRRDAVRRLTGTSSPAGSIAKAGARSLSGVSSPAGLAAKRAFKIFVGSIAPSGVIQTVRSFLRSLDGQVSPSGTIGRRDTAKQVAGTASPAGSIARNPLKILTGSVSPSGAISALKSRVLSLAGAVSPTGLAVRLASKRTTGSQSPIGVLVKGISRRRSGASSPSGSAALLKTKLLTLAGVSSPAGAVAKLAAVVRSGSVSPSGTRVRSAARRLSGTIAPAGAIASLKTKLLTLAGSVSPTSTLRKVATRILTSSSSPSGAASRSTSIRLAGSISPTGLSAAIRQLFRDLVGASSPVGSLRRDVAAVRTGSVSPFGQIGRSITRTLGGFISGVGSILSSFVSGGTARQIETRVAAIEVTTTNLSIAACGRVTFSLSSPTSAGVAAISAGGLSIGASRAASVQLRAFTV